MGEDFSQGKQEKKSTFRKIIGDCKGAVKVMAESPRVIKLIWKANPLNTILLVVLSFVLGVLPLVNIWVSKEIVDVVSSSIANKAPFNLPDVFSLPKLFAIAALAKLIPLLAMMLCLELVSALLQPATRYLEELLGDRLTRDINELIMRKSISLPDISFFESSEYYDKLQKAQQESGYRPMHILNGLMTILRAGVQFSVALASFLFLQPITCVLLLCFSVPSLIVQFRHNREQWALNRWEAPEVRRMHYFRHALTDKSYAAELRMFSLGQYFLEKYFRKFDEYYAKHKELRTKQCRKSMLLNFAATFCEAGAYSLLALRAAGGAISLGNFYFYSSMLSQIQNQTYNLIWSVSSLYEDNLFMSNLFEFLDMKTSMPLADPSWVLQVPKPIQKGIQFRNVSFHYPGSENDVLSDLNFTLSPDQTIALVGENGAGKTTIVKLLGRLYDPTGGEILIDGINLKDIDLESWRNQMSVIFQDFAAYQLTAGENIGIGQVNFVEDENRIKAAAERGGAVSVIEKLPKGYETLLGKWFGMQDEASDLSGGEWQKIALARAFMRAPDSEIDGFDRSTAQHLRDGAAQVLILDEPTASLDVQSEHDIYLRFQELTRGKMTLLISHRFSTVRMANLILLLSDGKIQEAGSHEELMALAGSYARLYKLQADKYN